jgi:hypothetical protein
MRLKSLTFEMEIEKAKEFIKELKKYVKENSTSVVFNFNCYRENWKLYPNTYNIISYEVEFGGEKI